MAATTDAELIRRKVDLDTHEEELAAREEVLAAKLRGKDDKIQAIVAQRPQELKRKHKDAIEAQLWNTPTRSKKLSMLLKL